MNAESRDTQTCLNCGAGLSGQYCGQCGQRATDRLISLWELTRDAFGDLFELDSRLWRTLHPLLIRPGALTRDYLLGRRARYMPPFRMYLVLSLLFFVIAFFDPREELAILYDTTDEVSVEAESQAAAARRQETREVLEELAREGVIDEARLGPDTPLSKRFPAAETSEEAAGQAAETTDDVSGLNITISDDETRCNVGPSEWGNAPEFIQRRFSAERMQAVCERVMAVGAAGVIAALLDRVPVALLILLPVMAVVLKLLYPLSRRYYVEHLLFVVHFNAFLFLLLTLQILWSRLIHVTGLPGAVSVVPIVATSLYVPVYLYKSMRRVYEQGHALTAAKFSVLTVTYSIGIALMMLASLLIAVFSI